jgi:hypothetical protein
VKRVNDVRAVAFAVYRLGFRKIVSSFKESKILTECQRTCDIKGK